MLQVTACAEKEASSLVNVSCQLNPFAVDILIDLR